MRAALAGLALVACTMPAAARHHCGHGQILRVSMGVCVGAHSRLAREVEVVARTIERPARPRYYIEVTIPAQKPAEPPQAAPEVSIPYSLPDSRMWNPPARFTPWMVQP